jgi:hypothetical protein
VVLDGVGAASPPVATTVASPNSFVIREQMPSTWAAKPYSAPDCMDSVVFLPITLRGSTISTRNSAAARPYSASMLISTPGRIAPPRYSPFPEMASSVVAVPKSMTIVGPP